MTKLAFSLANPITVDSVEPPRSAAEKFVLAPQATKTMKALDTLLKDARRVVLRNEAPGMWIDLGLERQDGVHVEIPIGADFSLVGERNCKLSSIEDLLLGEKLTNVMGMRRARAWAEPNGFARCCAKPLILGVLVPLSQIEADDSKGSSEVDRKVIVGSLSLLNVSRIGLFRAKVDGYLSRQLTKAWVHKCDELEGIVARVKLLHRATSPQDRGVSGIPKLSEEG